MKEIKNLSQEQMLRAENARKKILSLFMHRHGELSEFSTLTRIKELLKTPGLDLQTDLHGTLASALESAMVFFSEAVKLILPYLSSQQILSYSNIHGRTLLMSAAQFDRNGEVTQLILDAGATAEYVNAKTELGTTALHFACREGNFDAVKLLAPHISAGEIVAKDKTAFSPLMIAAAQGYEHIVQFLVQAGISGKIASDFDDDLAIESALGMAAVHGNFECTRVLLQDGINGITPELICKKDSLGRTIFSETALYGHVDVVSLLIDRGLTGDQINIQNNEGFTPLMSAAYDGNLDMVERLLPHLHATHLQAKNDDDKTALDLAVDQGHADVASMLVTALHKKTCEETVFPILRTVAKSNNADMLLNLWSTGFVQDHLEYQDKEGLNLLMIAAAHGATDVMKILIEYHNDFSLKKTTIDGKTALMYAIQTGIHDSVKMLLDAGASLDCHDVTGETPLMMAARWDKEMVQLLLDSGLTYEDISWHDNYGHTALMNAAESGDAQTIRLLLDSGLTLKDINRTDGTSGMAAIDYAETDEIKRLIQDRLDELTEKA